MKDNSSAGLLMCRLNDGVREFFLVHPGGPFYKNRDKGVWSIPKGLPEQGEEFLSTAQREFFEETGIRPEPPFYELGTIKQKSGKVVHAWTFEGAWDPATGIHCNTFPVEWPPRSGKTMTFPEVDKARWMDFDEAAKMILPAQRPFLERGKAVYLHSG
jgi:predicted NUDIX family NTP pyrophosphohydrolase